MRELGILIWALLEVHRGHSCLTTNQRYGPYAYAPSPGPQAALPAPSSGGGGSGFRAFGAAGADRPEGEAVGQSPLVQQLLGPSASTREFTSDGYNAKGGGPVENGAGLTCDFDNQPCCWANVPPPDDQLDWQLASGPAQSSNLFTETPTPTGGYLVAYASNAAPSDEAHFASCAIACASSPIRVRARHWQSENVLLQVCQRESFPSTINYNPLLNCQEFPSGSGTEPTELILPAASLIDIVFVASNFVGETGDIAILDDISIAYDSDPKECQQVTEEISSTTTDSPTPLPQTTEMSRLSVQREPKQRMKVGEDCLKAKCTFEDGSTCSYRDAHQSQSIRGLTTRFQVVTGQFMNRVTGVRQGIGICSANLALRMKYTFSEGDFYAATFLYPREMAGMQAEVGNFTSDRRIRFSYYEGTHGLQLKGCCDSLETCMFTSDKFVSVSDRTWKMADFICPKGTSKIVFVCENTRTNQGACALDDVQVFAPSLSQQKPLC